MKWINCKERLPSDMERVLVIDPFDNEIEAAIFTYNRFNSLRIEEEIANVEWWMRLKDIPKPD